MSGALPERTGLIGYTAGVFDLFHIGHLNLLRASRAKCDHLVVGVTTDELAERRKGARPVMPLIERMEIVQSVRYVDHVLTQVTMDTEVRGFVRGSFMAKNKGLWQAPSY